MKTLAFICSSSIPVIIFIIIALGLIKKIAVFDAFCIGAKEGLKTSVSIMTPIIGLMSGIAMLRASGVLDVVTHLISPLTKLIGLNENLLPLALLRPISGSGSIGIVTELVNHFGADSALSKTACVMAGSTETTFYTLAVYFGAVGIKKTRHSVTAALLTDVASILISLIVCNIFFGR